MPMPKKEKNLSAFFKITKKSIFIFLLIAAAAGCTKKNEEVLLRIGNWEIKAEIADTQVLRAKGLMHRKSLDENGGMLFVFPFDDKRSFWMKNTLIPLSIAYIAADGTIKEIYDMEPLSSAAVRSKYSVRYALEVNAGNFEKHGVKPGDRIIFPSKSDL